MPIEVIAVGNAAATSASFTVTAAAPVALSVKGSGGIVIPSFNVSMITGLTTQPPIVVQSQADDGAWFNTGLALTPQNQQLLIDTPGVYRVRRNTLDGATSGVGVFRSDP